MKLPEWVEENKVSVIVSLVGLLFVILGIWQSVGNRIREDSIVTVLKEEEKKEEDIEVEVVVDVGGAVESPGVYRLKSGSRINDLLVMAGGLSVDANRDYISRSINLAEKVADGTKIYIPYKDDPSVDKSKSIMSASDNVGDGLVISVNRGSVSELDSLWGIGDARARQIVDNRPYASLDELVTKASIPQNVIDKNIGKIGL